MAPRTPPVVVSRNTVTADQYPVIADLDKVIAGHGTVVSERDMVIAGHGTVIAEPDMVIADRDMVIAAHGTVVSEPDMVIAAHGTVIADLDKVIAAHGMFNSDQGTAAVDLYPDDTDADDSIKFRFAILDTLALTKRNLLHLVREPGLLIFTFVQPVLFVLLFRYVFGGTLGQLLGMNYVNYLLPGIFVQAVALGAVSTAIGLAEDLGGGIIERFRSLPMVRMSVLAARTIADLVRNIGIVVVMLLVGMLIGFRPYSMVGVIKGGVLVLAFAFSLSWLLALVGLRSTSAEAAQAIGFPLLLPLTFASSAFVPVNTMPGWLQAFAANQPVTIVVNACRGLMLGPDAVKILQASGSFTTDTAGYVIRSLVWIVLILAVSVPLAIRRFNES